jgi:hypothetical protein
LRVHAEFIVKNTGRVAAYKWALVARAYGNYPRAPDDYIERLREFIKNRGLVTRIHQSVPVNF